MPRLTGVRTLPPAFAALAVALTLAPSAGAAFGPPLVGVPATIRSLPVLKLKTTAEQAPSSCSAHALQRPRGVVGHIERKLAPVACEQPPRSKLLSSGFAFFFAP